ncbi:fumarylacetoacetate hydrolase family protein [Agromyces sp. PvR057]|uniref:2-keto-4-pentenoate hydratase n=1 Tax=Agromyces sp. PvR057 TaxID=3156403 RepID=UPI000E25EC53
MTGTTARTAPRDGLTALAEALDAAQLHGAPVAQSGAAMTLAEAYSVQHLLVERRTSRGDRISGVKLGFTSRAKAIQMGVDDVIIGSVTERMRVEDGGLLEAGGFIHPRIEPELAYLIGSDLPADADDAALRLAVVGVAPALEIIDSRYLDFRFDLEDVVADNTSAAAYVIGPWTDAATAGDLGNRGVRLEVDGRLCATGSTAAILGHPDRALATALRMSRAHGFELRAGMVLLAGAATAAVPLPHGAHVAASVTGLGSVSMRFGGGHE